MGLSVILVDDHTMLRQGIRRALELEGIKVVAEASDGAEAIRLALEHKPDVVLMDVSMPGMDGVEAARRLVEADGRQRVVMMTMHIDRDIIDRAIRAGAVGYLTKDSSISEVILAIQLAANGDRPMSPRLAAAMLERDLRCVDLGSRGRGAATRRRRIRHQRDRRAVVHQWQDGEEPPRRSTRS